MPFDGTEFRQGSGGGPAPRRRGWLLSALGKATLMFAATLALMAITALVGVAVDGFAPPPPPGIPGSSPSIAAQAATLLALCAGCVVLVRLQVRQALSGSDDPRRDDR